MNDLFFACCDCKVFVNAGDRWAYWTLEDAGIVKRGAPISVAAVLYAAGYWSPQRNEQSDWFYEGVFPSVRSFLKEHESHRIIFGDKDDFLFGSDENYWAFYFDWMQVGFLAAPSLRSFVEQAGLRTWDEVCDYVAGLDREIWWMHDKEMRARAKRKFEELVEAKGAT
jgi:hypothetical protein